MLVNIIFIIKQPTQRRYGAWLISFLHNSLPLCFTWIGSVEPSLQKKSVKHWYLFLICKSFSRKLITNFLFIWNFVQKLNMQLSYDFKATNAPTLVLLKNLNLLAFSVKMFYRINVYYAFWNFYWLELRCIFAIN